MMNSVRIGKDGRNNGRKHSGGFVVAVAGGKGGVGKTNLAVNLGIQLARRQDRIVLMDADFGLANADILLNVSPLANFTDVLDRTRGLDELLVEGPCGLRVLCGISGTGERRQGKSLGPQDCERALRRLNQYADAVLVDCGAGVSSTTAAFALASDLLVLVTTPEPTALADTYATLKLLHHEGFGGRASVVVNMARGADEARRVASRVTRVVEQFLGLPVDWLGYVPMDRHVPLAVRARQPVVVRYPRCGASACIASICDRICPPVTTRSRMGAVWARMASLFL